MAHCDIKIKKLVDREVCRTKFIAQLFPRNDASILQEGCLCCDWCRKKCTRIDHESIDKMSSQKEMTEMRPRLRKKLLQYRNSLLPSSTAEFIRVASTGIFFEFGNYQIAQVLQNCDNLFTIFDIVDSVEICRNVHANNIFNAMSEVFGDMDVSSFPLPLSEEDFVDMEVIDDAWEILQNDTSRGELFENSVIEHSLVSMLTEENSLYDSFVGCVQENLSGLLAPITDVIGNMEI